MGSHELRNVRVKFAVALAFAVVLPTWSFDRPESCATAAESAERLHDIPSDLQLPELRDGMPAAGVRVRCTFPEYAGSSLHHVVYLPTDWRLGPRHPVLVEYPGNGGFKNALGDESRGRVEDCKLGYGISGGSGSIWICLPFVNPATKSHALQWWGDPDATAAYCRAAVKQACTEWGGDPERVVLMGFSRGAIAGNYIGLRDDDTAQLWRAMILHSHYDGVRKWGYPGDDAESARVRLARLGDRPQFVTHEQSIEATARFLGPNHPHITLRALPFPNHSDEWVLKDLPLRRELREWLARVMK